MLNITTKTTDRIITMKDRKQTTNVNTTALNRQFIIRMKYRCEKTNRKVNRLITGRQFAELVGARSIHKVYTRVWNSLEDDLTISLRRGIQFDFVYR